MTPDNVLHLRAELRGGRVRRDPRARADRTHDRLGRMHVRRRRAGGGHFPRLLLRLASECDRALDRCAAGLQPVARPDRRLGGGALDRRAILRRHVRRGPERCRPGSGAARAEAGQRRFEDRVRRARGGAQGPTRAAVGVRGSATARPRPPRGHRCGPRGRRAAARPGRRRHGRHRNARARGRRGAMAAPARRRRAVRPFAGRRELRHGPDRGVRGRHSGRRIRDRRLPPGGDPRPGRPAGAARATPSHLPRRFVRCRSTRRAGGRWASRRGRGRRLRMAACRAAGRPRSTSVRSRRPSRSAGWRRCAPRRASCRAT